MSAFVRDLRVELARLELLAVLGEFPSLRSPWEAQRVLRRAAGRCSFRDAAIEILSERGTDADPRPAVPDRMSTLRPSRGQPARPRGIHGGGQ